MADNRVSRWWLWAAIVLAVLLVVGTLTGQVLSFGSGDAGVGDVRPTTTTHH